MLDRMFEPSTNRVLDDAQANPIERPRPEPGFWSGILTAVPRGVGVAANESARTLYRAAVANQDEVLARQQSEADFQVAESIGRRRVELQSDRAVMDDRLKAGIDYWRPDPMTTGSAAQFVMGVTGLLTKATAYSLATGSPIAGAAMTGADVGFTEYLNLRDKDVDFGTAAKVGLARGIGTGVAVALPVAGSTLLRTFGLAAAGGPVSYVAENATARAILQNADYGALADQIDPFDPANIAAVTVASLAFGLGAHGFRALKAKGATDAPPPDAGGMPPFERKPAAEAVDAALVVMQRELRDARRLADPGDFRATAADDGALSAAELQFARGDLVEVGHLAPVRDGQTAPPALADFEANILDQLNRAGRFPAEVNESYAALTREFYEETAARLGISPDEMVARYGLRVEGEGGEGGIVLEQGAKVDRLQMVAERGERAVNKSAELSPEERAAVANAAAETGAPASEVRATVVGHKAAHPVSKGWAPLTFNRVVKDDKGKLDFQYKAIPYDFNRAADGATLKPGTPEYQSRVTSIARSMIDEVRSVYKRSLAGDKNAQNIIEQASWYRAMRGRLRQEFGGLGDLFADLLGATSPNTPVRTNWDNAVEALRSAMRGDFDQLLPKWVEWADRVEALETDFRAWFNERMAEGLTKKAIKALPDYEARYREVAEARKLPEELIPIKGNEAKFGFNGRNVVKAMVDLWRVVRDADPDIGRGGTAPKAINFSGNLIGFRERATIDVWAARMLQRLAGGKRIPSMAETGVTGAMRADGTTTLQFGFGQDVFSDAARRIRGDAELSANDVLAKINDDDLQALVWFIEKEVWTKNNWTSAAGEGGSFELEASLTGTKQQERVRELRKIIDSTKSKPEEKAKAKQELAKLERTVDRFTGGLSIQKSAETQGVDFIPADSDMAQLAASIRTAIYAADDGATVLGSKALSTEGRYGGVERSLDLEVVAREGYDPNSLWLEMLQQAQRADQDSTFLSRVLRDDEEPNLLTHRPGVEIYFRDSAARENLEAMLAELQKEGVEFLTVIVDGRRLPAAMRGEMPPAVGVRLQYIPEFEQRYGMDDLRGLDDAALESKLKEKASELRKIAERVSAEVEGVSFADQFWYETQVAFRNEYQGKIDAITSRAAEGSDRGVGGQKWAGQPVREGIESASRQADQAAGGEPRGDVGGDAVYAQQGQADAVAPKRGRISFGPDITQRPSVITLLEDADLSTYLHESGHLFLEVYSDIAARSEVPPDIAADMNTLLAWFEVPDMATWRAMTPEQRRPHHERFAQAFEAYLFEGKAPRPELQGLFERFKAWLVDVYESLVAMDVELTPEVRGVFDRMLGTRAEAAPRAEAPPAAADAEARYPGVEAAVREDGTRVSADEYLRQVEEEAKIELANAELVQVAAECFIEVGGG